MYCIIFPSFFFDVNNDINTANCPISKHVPNIIDIGKLFANPKNAILCKGEYIAAFGNGDLILFGGGLECYTDFPCSYSCTDRPVEKYAITNGERIFGLKDVEVFQIVYIC